ncbi:MAG TPA: CU044_2847 family protein [Pseudonocardiaceae bacterium]|nr:CU044_2847 family protein [Pseudonocardiaceae bacterium]
MLRWACSATGSDTAGRSERGGSCGPGAGWRGGPAGGDGAGGGHGADGGAGQGGRPDRRCVTVAQPAIVEVASSTAEVVETLGQRARRPDQLEVEFGLSFTAKGNVIVVGGEAGAALRVKVVYDARQGG